MELPLDPLRDMEGAGAGAETRGPGPLAGGVIVLECNTAGAWPEDKTTNVYEKISMSMTRGRDMMLSNS